MDIWMVAVGKCGCHWLWLALSLTVCAQSCNAGTMCHKRKTRSAHHLMRQVISANTKHVHCMAYQMYIQMLTLHMVQEFNVALGGFCILDEGLNLLLRRVLVPSAFFDAPLLFVD